MSRYFTGSLPTRGARSETARRPHSTRGPRGILPLGEGPAPNTEKNWMRQMRREEPLRVPCLEKLLEIENDLGLGAHARAEKRLGELAELPLWKQFLGPSDGARRMREMLPAFLRRYEHSEGTATQVLKLMLDFGMWDQIRIVMQNNDVDAEIKQRINTHLNQTGKRPSGA